MATSTTLSAVPSATSSVSASSSASYATLASTSTGVDGPERAWIQAIEDSLHVSAPAAVFALVHCESLVGLCTLVWVRTSKRDTIRDIETKCVKTGLRGMHGNKVGARVFLRTHAPPPPDRALS